MKLPIPSNKVDSSNPSDPAAGLAPAPLITGEDAATYNGLLARLTGTLKPSDALEDIWVRDVVDLVWEVFRLRRLKAHLMRASAYEGLAQVLKPLVKWETHDDLAQQWHAGEEEAVATVKRVLTSAGLTTDAVMAHTLAARINDVERIDRMMMAAEMRRDNILREFERRRSALGLRRAIHEAEDAEFKLLPLDHSGDAP
jgi:hypothetical protein